MDAARLARVVYRVGMDEFSRCNTIGAQNSVPAWRGGALPPPPSDRIRGGDGAPPYHAGAEPHAPLYLTLVMVIALLGSCKTTEETLVGKPPETGAAKEQSASVAPTEPPDRPRYPAPRLTIASWPYVEPNTTFVLTWSGGDKAAPLHEAPDPNSRLLGDVVWENGERILWTDTAVASYEPRVLQSTEEWFVEGPVYRGGYLVDQEYVQLEVPARGRVEVWAYAGDGQCYLGKGAEIFTGPCPPPDRFTGFGPGRVAAELYMSPRKMWWIQITGNNITGWVPVDDRMTVDIVSE